MKNVGHSISAIGLVTALCLVGCSAHKVVHQSEQVSESVQQRTTTTQTDSVSTQRTTTATEQDSEIRTIERETTRIVFDTLQRGDIPDGSRTQSVKEIIRVVEKIEIGKEHKAETISTENQTASQTMVVVDTLSQSKEETKMLESEKSIGEHTRWIGFGIMVLTLLVVLVINKIYEKKS